MKVFKFNYDGVHTAICSETIAQATDYFKEIVTDEFDEIVEIPESEWDEKIITFYEDNDLGNNSFQISIRDAITSDTSIIYTNDDSLIY